MLRQFSVLSKIRLASRRSFGTGAHVKIGEKMGVGIRNRLPKAGMTRKQYVFSSDELQEWVDFWRNSNEFCKPYSDDELLMFREVFYQYAQNDVLMLTSFQRLIKSKNKDLCTTMALPTVSIQAWNEFDDDGNNRICFGEFVHNMPRFEANLLRQVLSKGDRATEVFNQFAKDGKLGLPEFKALLEHFEFVCPCETVANKFLINSESKTGFNLAEFKKEFVNSGSLSIPFFAN